MLLNKKTINTTPTEYNVYSGEGVFSSYRLAYGITQKNYYIYNHLGSKAVEVDSAGNIIDYVQYSPFGEPLKKNNYQPQWNERLGYIDKEKDRESKLGDHGVRKYDYEIGRFTSVDPFWEKYTGWTGYQYCGNNPVNASDGNGKWVKEISKEAHRHKGTISRNSNGYLANKINYEFYDNYKINAPKIAKFIQEKNLFVMQSKLEGNTYGQAELGGNLSEYDLSKKSEIVNLEGEVLHEIVHNMGYQEGEAYGAMIAAGYLSKEQMIKWIKYDPFIYLHGTNDLLDDYLYKRKSSEEITEIITQRGATIIGECNED